jgi:phosphoglycolate phosphatase
MIKLVIVDFDDTLTLTEEAAFAIENSVAEQMGFLPMTREDHQKNWGKPLQEAIVERIPGINVDAFMKIMEKELPIFASKGLVDKVTKKNIAVLEKLRSEGIRLAILTSRVQQEMIHILDTSHELHQWIEKVYYADNSSYLKPDPRAFDQILAHFSVDPTEALYVGDSLGDGVGAKGAGLHFIALLESGLRTEEDFKSVSVDYFAQQFPDILRYLEKQENISKRK